MISIILLSLLLSVCNSYKILVINPKFGYSHMNFFGRVADTLVDAGHEVVTLQPVVDPTIAGNGTSKSRLIQLPPSEASMRNLDELHDPESMKLMWTASARNPLGVILHIPILCRMIEKSLSEVLDEKQLLAQLKAENFDVAITELFDFMGIGILEAIGVKNIVGGQSNSFFEGTSLAVGVPIIPSYTPAALGITGDTTDFWTRAINLAYSYFSYHFQNSMAMTTERVMRQKLGPAITPVWDVVANMTWLIANSEPLMEFPRPVLHKVVEVGGLGVHAAKPLNEEWDRLLNLRPQTILISFGSVAKSVTMPLEMKLSILEVVKSFPNITFIWKYEKPDEAFLQGVENLFASKWTPQVDLLADERLTLFITHGGAGSMLESAIRAKPLVVFPLFGDQSRNGKLIEKYGFGALVEKSYLSNSKLLHDVIERVLNDPKYRIAAKRISNLLARRPFSPQEKLVKTIELAAEFGDLPQLKVAGRNLSYMAYYNLDLIVILLALVIAACSLLMYLVFNVIRRLLPRLKVKVQ